MEAQALPLWPNSPETTAACPVPYTMHLPSFCAVHHVSQAGTPSRRSPTNPPSIGKHTKHHCSPWSRLGNLFWVSSWQAKAGPRLWVANALLPAGPELKIYLRTSSEKRFTKQTNSGWGMGSVDNKPRRDKLCSRDTFPKTGLSAHSSMSKTIKSIPIIFPRS